MDPGVDDRAAAVGLDGVLAGQVDPRHLLDDRVARDFETIPRSLASASISSRVSTAPGASFSTASPNHARGSLVSTSGSGLP